MQRDNLRNSQSPATIPFCLPLPGSASPIGIDRRQEVAVTYSGDPSIDEIADMVIDVLHQQGVAAQGVRDGEAAAFNADVLLILGSGRWFPQFAEAAKQRIAKRPRVILWHLQPLPPPVLTERAGKLSERLLAARWEDLLGTWASGLSRLIPAQGQIRGILQRLLAVPMRRELERLGGAEYGNVAWDDLCMIFQEAAWLSENLAGRESWIDLVACSTPTRVAFLRQCGVVARFVPLGFHAGWGELPIAERDIDVLFVGSLNAPSRRGLVPEVLHQLRDWGYRTCEVDLFPHGRMRTELVRRARVVLNVLRFPWEFPGPRLFASAACGALCVSNEAIQNEPFQAGLHFIRAPRARMAQSISWYLTNEEERRRRAERALQSFTTDFPLLTSVGKLLNPALQAGQPRLSRAA
jgi:hypothetical protein